jgi:hypothetical protein
VPEPAVGQDGWLKGSSLQKFETIAGQLRGFDMAMVETGYRFTELYFAGEDQNWDYAKYQAEKIGTAIRNGLERRPKRAASAETFLNTVLPDVLKAIEQKDLELFRQRFHVMHSTCITCHSNEKVAFIPIVIPRQRTAPVGPPENQAAPTRQ